MNVIILNKEGFPESVIFEFILSAKVRYYSSERRSGLCGAFGILLYESRCLLIVECDLCGVNNVPIFSYERPIPSGLNNSQSRPICSCKVVEAMTL